MATIGQRHGGNIGSGTCPFIEPMRATPQRAAHPPHFTHMLYHDRSAHEHSPGIGAPRLSVTTT